MIRQAHAGDAEHIARFHTESWQRTYRGMMSDAFLDGGALENRLRVWKERLETPTPHQHVSVAEDASDAGTSDLQDPGGGHAPNCRYVWASPEALRFV